MSFKTSFEFDDNDFQVHLRHSLADSKAHDYDELTQAIEKALAER